MWLLYIRLWLQSKKTSRTKERTREQRKVFRKRKERGGTGGNEVTRRRGESVRLCACVPACVCVCACACVCVCVSVCVCACLSVCVCVPRMRWSLVSLNSF